ncbi:MAG TPA: DUF6306 domain-containing protein [Burkholderiales bacterium]|nr:DUF6306 domain-containing protein [Burkholderiales bacterium]
MSGSAPAFARAEWCAFLNRMLEAERAGARALLEFLGEYPRDGEAWKVLRKVQGDEAHNCVVLGEVLKRAGEPYSHATGEFLDEALAVRGRRARLEFLCRGLGWSVREIEGALPRVPDEAGVKALTRIRDTHRGSLAACNALLKTTEL